MNASLRLPRGRMDRKRADRVVAFLQNLTLSTDGIKPWAGSPFTLHPFQRDPVREIFGRMQAQNPKRRAYRTAFLGVPRKNGKSELAAGLGLYGLIGDGVRRGQVYSAAAEKEQAAQVFNAAVAMVRADPELDADQGGRIVIKEANKRMVDLETGSFYQAISAEAYSKHGFNASMVIYDELHAAPNRDLWDVLETSMGARWEPLMIAITTAGSDKTSICWEMWEYARGVMNGTIDDPTFFARIYEAPEDADWTDEELWRRVNPAIDAGFRDIEEMRMLFRRAQHKPERQNTFKRLYLNQWTQQETRWLDMGAWSRCQTVAPEEFGRLPTWAGLDLGRSDDMSALVGATPLPDGRVGLRAIVWLPEQARETYRMRPYESWEAAGAIKLTEGNVTDYAVLEWDILRAALEWNIVELAYDPNFAEGLRQRLMANDDTEGRAPAMTERQLIPQSQGYALNMGLRELEELSVSGRLGHNGHLVLTWSAGNAVTDTGQKGDIRVNKLKANEKIDPIVALAEALQRMVLARQPAKSAAEDEDYEMEAQPW